MTRQTDSIPGAGPAVPQHPRVWAIVLNYNGAPLTEACVSRLRDCEVLDRILVVDNGSRREDYQRVLEATADERGVPVSLERLDTNYGYAGGMQAGIMVALERGAGLVYLVNNDCSVNSDAVSVLVETMRAHPQLAACAGPVDHGGWVDGGSRVDHIRFRNIREAVRSGTYEVEFPPGDAWMLSLDAVRQVGGLDCRLFLTGEEPDWCFRARMHGWGIRMVPAALVSAEMSATMARYAAERQFYESRNRLWLARRQLAGWRKILALALFLVYRLPRASLGRILRRDGAGLSLLLRGGFVGVFGDCRWSDKTEDALGSRVGRLGSADALPEPR